MSKRPECIRASDRSPVIEKSRSKYFRLGVMGGTFDPIHYGHLVAAEQARSKFRLHEVTFVPSGVPPHKTSRTLADSEHRYLMTVLATSTNAHFSVSRTEIDREGPSYAVDTIRYFMDLYKEYNPRIFFITGMDAVMEILSWRSPETIMELCTVIAATRPGFDTDRLKKDIGAKNYNAVKLLRASALAISSTDIRDRVENDRPIKYLLPESVEQYIKRNRLYSKEGK